MVIDRVSECGDGYVSDCTEFPQQDLVQQPKLRFLHPELSRFLDNQFQCWPPRILALVTFLRPSQETPYVQVGLMRKEVEIESISK